MKQSIALAPFQQGLKKGTQILMSDNSLKNIEDIQYGDMIKSIDLISKEYMAVKCYGTIRTQPTDLWKRPIFRNGSYLDVNNEATIYNSTRGLPIKTSIWSTGDRGFDQNMRRIELAWIQDYEDIIYSEGYILLSENSLYFANGILCGHQPHEKLKYHSLGVTSPQLTEEDIKDFELSAKAQQANNDTRLANSLYIVEAAPILAEISRTHRNLETYQQELTLVNSNTNKYNRQLLKNIEHNNFVDYYQNINRKISDEKAEQAVYNLQFKLIKKRYPAGSKVSAMKIFRQTHAAENARIKQLSLLQEET